MRLPGRRTIAAAFAVVVMSVVTVSIPLYITQAQQQAAARIQQEHDSYVASNRHDYQLGQTCRLDSAEDMQGADAGYVARFDWDGTIEATLLSADYYDSLAATGLDTSKMFEVPEDLTGTYVLVCRMQLTNVDAHNQEGKNSFSWQNYALLVDDVKNQPPNAGPMLCYFDGIGPKGAENPFAFQLAPGQKRVFTAAYLVPDSYREGSLFYSIGADAVETHKYNIHVPQAPGKPEEHQ